jgi:hypothetical protein
VVRRGEGAYGGGESKFQMGTGNLQYQMEPALRFGRPSGLGLPALFA